METPLWFPKADRRFPALLFAMSLWLSANCPSGLLQAQEPAPESESSPEVHPNDSVEPLPDRPWPSDPFAWLFGTGHPPAATPHPRAVFAQFSVRQVYDDRMSAGSDREAAGTYTLFEPLFRLVHADDSGNEWRLDYRLQGRLYPRFSQNNTLGQEAELRWDRRFNDRLALTLRSNYQSHPGGAVEGLSARSGLATPGSGDANVGFLFHKQINREFLLDLDYLASSTLRFNLGGRFSSRSFAQLPLPRTRRAEVFLVGQRQLSPAHTLGAAYELQKFDYGGAFGHTLVHNPLLLYAHRFYPSVTLTAFGGPAWIERAERPSSAVLASTGALLPEPLETKSLRRWTGGVSVTKTAGRTSLETRYAQSFAPGAGLLATVQRRAAEFTLARDFSRHLRLGVQAEYSDNKALDADLRFRSAAIQPVLRYRLSRQWTLVVEPRLGRLWGLEGTRRSRVSASAGVDYQFPERPY